MQETITKFVSLYIHGSRFLAGLLAYSGRYKRENQPREQRSDERMSAAVSALTFPAEKFIGIWQRILLHYIFFGSGLKGGFIIQTFVVEDSQHFAEIFHLLFYGFSAFKKHIISFLQGGISFLCPFCKLLHFPYGHSCAF